MKRKKTVRKRHTPSGWKTRRETELDDLHHQLQDPVELPPEQKDEMLRLRSELAILTKQHHDALTQLNLRSNIEVAFNRLGRAVESVADLIRQLNGLQIGLADAAKSWRIVQAVAKDEQVEADA